MSKVVLRKFRGGGQSKTSPCRSLDTWSAQSAQNVHWPLGTREPIASCPKVICCPATSRLPSFLALIGSYIMLSYHQYGKPFGEEQGFFFLFWPCFFGWELICIKYALFCSIQPAPNQQYNATLPDVLPCPEILQWTLSVLLSPSVLGGHPDTTKAVNQAKSLFLAHF